MNHPEPPSKPSELIRLALRDLKAVESDPDYVVEMAEWHAPRDDGYCALCFAGAVMAKSLQMPRDLDYYFKFDFSPAWEAAFEALNGLRSGQTYKTNERFHVTERVPCRVIPEYSEDPAAFHLAMEALAAEYEAVGA